MKSPESKFEIRELAVFELEVVLHLLHDRRVRLAHLLLPLIFAAPSSELHMTIESNHFHCSYAEICLILALNLWGGGKKGQTSAYCTVLSTTTVYIMISHKEFKKGLYNSSVCVKESNPPSSRISLLQFNPCSPAVHTYDIKIFPHNHKLDITCTRLRRS